MLLALARRLRHPPATDQPSRQHGDTPDTAGEVVCIDCTATSLDRRYARLLAVAAVPLRGNRLLTSQALHLSVDPAWPRALPPLDAAAQLLRYIGQRPLVGYYLDFDFALLAPLFSALLGHPLPNRGIDVSALYYARRVRGRPVSGPDDLRFETIRRDLGLPALSGRSALSHAVLAGLMYLKLSTPDRPTPGDEPP